ncbi:hypothetical protein D7X94_11690 [Acutalibacter sp. 1XD8-33]|nr:hypothetical protein D7X94_11690 [Acutalibacter sp. 1XD8-33]
MRDESLLQLNKKLPWKPEPASGVKKRTQPGEFSAGKRKDKPSYASVYLFDTTAKPSLLISPFLARRASSTQLCKTHDA